MMALRKPTRAIDNSAINWVQKCCLVFSEKGQGLKKTSCEALAIVSTSAHMTSTMVVASTVTRGLIDG